ncbi:MAG: 16S rRNA (cytosine(967)-C(5))-methyltransferase RsmB, partial [Clostridia bacterium]|nr:16S rRNA (cytosine(967)-C(5))-methyltransferase RsmB [Clostridia bacterium]
MRAVDGRSGGGRASPAREAALRALRAIEGGLAPKTALGRALGDELGGPDRALATSLVYGVTRERARLDDRLARLVRRPLSGLDPATRAILRMAAYQLLSLDRVPRYAAVHEAVELAKRHAPRGRAAFVNAVLRALVRDEEGQAAGGAGERGATPGDREGADPAD